MGSYGTLRVGSLVIAYMKNGVSNELLAIFRDDMLNLKPTPAIEYYSVQNGYEPSDDVERDVTVTTFQAEGRVISDRLDIMGVTKSAAIRYLDQKLQKSRQDFADRASLTVLSKDLDAHVEQDIAFRSSIDSQRWLELLTATPEDTPGADDRTPGSRWWLMNELSYAGWADDYELYERYALRLALLAFPDAEVVLDLTAIDESGWLNNGVTGLASAGANAIADSAVTYAPVVVLTEGRNDAEFLTAGIEILYPHLNDMIRFLDYEGRPEGGAAALVRMVRAFAAAGIQNRVIAAFDNDTAAADSLRQIDASKLPSRIGIVQYPAIDLAKEYPTLGPPTSQSPTGSLFSADVNGLAGSIELYLGRDVLTQPDGKYYPIQWKSFFPGMGRYHGAVMGKEFIHRAFRAKYEVAMRKPELRIEQDWEGLRLVIDLIRLVAQDLF